MNKEDLKIGDKVWVIQCINAQPTLEQVIIVNILDDFVSVHALDYHLFKAFWIFDCIYSTKKEAVDSLIQKLHKINCDDGNHEWNESPYGPIQWCSYCEVTR